MKIKICIAYVLGFIVIGTLCGCGTSANETEPLFEELDAEEALTDYLVSSGILKSGMQLEDDQSMMWEEMSEREIAGTQCYVFDLLFSEDENINGIMAGHLFSSYAVSKDGQEFYYYNPADDI